MLTFLEEQNPILLAFLATLFTYSVTLIGASIVFLFKKVKKNIMDAMLGFAAGIMIAASFFSLLEPSLKMAESLKMIPWIVTTIGFISGGLLLFIGDRIFTKIDKKISKNKDENNKTKSLKRCIMLILSITLHNIPEGLAVGVAFGGIAYGIEGATLSSALMIALGIGIQNFPEGTAVSVPLRREGLSRKKAFFFGQLSGLVEPISGVLGALLILKVRTLLPFLLAFAAGAMIYVVVEELIPEAQREEGGSKTDISTLGCLAGFALMMILDVALG